MSSGQWRSRASILLTLVGVCTSSVPLGSQGSFAYSMANSYISGERGSFQITGGGGEAYFPNPGFLQWDGEGVLRSASMLLLPALIPSVFPLLVSRSWALVTGTVHCVVALDHLSSGQLGQKSHVCRVQGFGVFSIEISDSMFIYSDKEGISRIVNFLNFSKMNWNPHTCTIWHIQIYWLLNMMVS